MTAKDTTISRPTPLPEWVRPEGIMLTVPQVARMANRHPRWVRSLIYRGYLPAMRNESGFFIVRPSDAATVLLSRARGKGRGPKPRRNKGTAAA